MDCRRGAPLLGLVLVGCFSDPPVLEGETDTDSDESGSGTASCVEVVESPPPLLLSSDVVIGIDSRVGPEHITKLRNVSPDLGAFWSGQDTHTAVVAPMNSGLGPIGGNGCDNAVYVEYEGDVVNPIQALEISAEAFDCILRPDEAFRQILLVFDTVDGDPMPLFNQAIGYFAGQGPTVIPWAVLPTGDCGGFPGALPALLRGAGVGVIDLCLEDEALRDEIAFTGIQTLACEIDFEYPSDTYAPENVSVSYAISGSTTTLSQLENCDDFEAPGFALLQDEDGNDFVQICGSSCGDVFTQLPEDVTFEITFGCG